MNLLQSTQWCARIYPVPTAVPIEKIENKVMSRRSTDGWGRHFAVLVDPVSRTLLAHAGVDSWMISKVVLQVVTPRSLWFWQKTGGGEERCMRRCNPKRV